MCEIPEGHKKCTKCGEIKAFGEFYKNKSKKDGYQYQCKHCIDNLKTIWNKNNPEKVKKTNRKKSKKWRENNPCKYKEVMRQNENKRIGGLSNGYVKKVLLGNRNLKASDIPQEMIELKRVQLQIHRHLKEMTK